MLKFDLILRNAKDEQNKVNYFKRLFKKAQDDYCEYDDFFPPLFNLIEEHKKSIEKEFNKKKGKLENDLDKAKRNEIDFTDDYYKKFQEEVVDYKSYKIEENVLAVKTISKKLEKLTKEKVRSNISVFKIKLSELNIIESALKEAEKEFKN